MKFWGHHYHRCEEENCGACNAGLTLCVVCGGAEESLTTHCPGHKMDPRTEDAVYGGAMDYFRGSWLVNGVRRERTDERS